MAEIIIMHGREYILNITGGDHVIAVQAGEWVWTEGASYRKWWYIIGIDVVDIDAV